MKKPTKTATSARSPQGEPSILHVKVEPGLHADFIRLGIQHGLTPGQAFNFLIGWAVNNSTLTPDLPEEWS